MKDPGEMMSVAIILGKIEGEIKNIDDEKLGSH